MLTIHDQPTHQICDGLETVVMGLGLVRLLQDARRFEEAKATLCSLEEGFQKVAERSDKKNPKPCKPHVTRPGRISLSGLASSGIATSEMRPQPLCIAECV